MVSGISRTLMAPWISPGFEKAQWLSGLRVSLVNVWFSCKRSATHVREDLRKVPESEFLKILVEPEVHRGIVVVDHAEP